MNSTGESFAALPAGWCCYLLLCADGSYYCGITENLRQRVLDHRYGKGSQHTRAKKPVALVWFERHPSQKAAAAREREIKKWGRRKKKALAERSAVGVSLIRLPADSG